MKKITTSSLFKGALLLFTQSIACYAMLMVFAVDWESLPTLTCTAFWGIEDDNSCGDSIIPEADMKITGEQSLANVAIEQFAESTMVNDQWSVSKVLGIHPDRNEQLAAIISFQYHEQDFGDLPKDQLIRYSSQDDGRIWQTPYNSIVDPAHNSIHLSGIEQFSLWKADLSAIYPAALAKDNANTGVFNQPVLPATTLTTIDEDVYIINMGQTPPTEGNVINPYGLIYSFLRECQFPIVYTTITYFMFWILDPGNGGIAEGYPENAGVSEDDYNWVEVGELTCCDDVFAMLHAKRPKLLMLRIA
jgi:hypothetical protein